MPLGETLHREVYNSPNYQKIFTATNQDYVVTGCVLSNTIYPLAFAEFRRNNNFLFSTEIKRGQPFQLLNKIFLVKDDILTLLLLDSIPSWEWNSSNYYDWNSGDVNRWNSGGGFSGLAKLELILTVSAI